jgi:hypothetical protein
MRVSSPEATALDLVRYYQDVGYYSNVVTVLSELADQINSRSLVSAAKCGVELAVVQRLGYFLELLGKDKLAESLKNWLNTKSPRVTSLRPDLATASASLNERWSLYINGVRLF